MAEFSNPDVTVHQIGDIETLSQSYQWGIEDLDIPSVWLRTEGEGVVICVLDSGVGFHEDLKDNIDYKRSRSFIDGELVTDEPGCHGIHVSGIIGCINDTKGVVGIAPKATIIGLKVLDKNGMSRNNSVLKALQYCETIKDLDIINMSLGGTGNMDAEHKVIKRLVAKGVVVCAAAGNNGNRNILKPAAFPEVFAIGSYSLALIRNRSPFSSWGGELDFLFPGDKILSSYCQNKYGVLSGSSMATPAASGVIALLIAKNKKEGKKLSVQEIKDILIHNCTDVDDPGFDEQSGYGIISVKNLFSGQNMVSEVVKPKKLTFWQRLKHLFN